MTVAGRLLNSRIERVSCESLTPHPRNPNRGNVEAVRASIRANGFYGTITVQESTGFVVAGNHRLEAAILEGIGEVDAAFVAVGDEEALRILLVDNRSSDLADYDASELTAILMELDETDQELEGTLYNADDLDGLLAELQEENENEPEDEEEPDYSDWEPPADPITQPGDVWTLGPHRMICADVLTSGLPAKVFAEQKADVVITDPPYAIYGSSTGIASDIADDKMVRPFFRETLQLLASNLKPFGHAYVCCDWRSWASWWEVSRGLMAPKNMIVWDKGSGLGGMYANCHELLFFASLRPERQTMVRGKKKIVGERMVNGSDIWKMNRAGNTETGDKRKHNAQKPIELYRRALEKSSDPGDLLFDPFSGSGTAIIAADRTKRRCVAFDVEAKWCDLAVERW